MADEAENKKLPEAKSISKLFKFICPLGLLVTAVLKWLGIFSDCTIGEACILWSVMYGLGAGTIDANIMIDKFRN